MKFWFITLLIGLLGGGLWLEWSRPFVFVLKEPTVDARAANATQPALVPVPAPVLIELFTSEGCSSCPPADKLLTQLAQAAASQNVELIPMSEHVDYWNYIGWADPFSSADFSERQRLYAQALGAHGARGDVYTPQMVVDGRLGFVGSNAAKAQDAIVQAAQTAKAQVRLTLMPDQTDTLRIHITDLPALSAPERADVLLAVTEDGLTSNVTRGENSGHRLPHTAVTRVLRALGEIPAATKSFDTTTVVKLDAHWQRQALRLVVFVQERTQRRILGAASLSLSGRLPQK